MHDQRWRFCVAPMMDWTDRHCRLFHRHLSARARLYTEMVTADAVIHGDRARLIGFSRAEQPVAIQLGGADPAKLARAARIAADEGYCEVNLNCGCPSDRVQDGRFGACLMLTPARVAEGVAAMKATVPVPVTVKCRIGVDDQDPEATLFGFAAAVKDAGADALIVHARKAWLQGLSPKENREVPPLDYRLVHRLKRAYRGWPIVLNGGIASLEQALVHLVPQPGAAPHDAGREDTIRDEAMRDEAMLDGVMLGRAAYQNPEVLLGVDPLLFGAAAPAVGIDEALDRLEPAIAAHVAAGGRLHAFTRHMVGLFPGRRGARAWRRFLATEGVKPGADVQTFRAARARVAPMFEAAA